MDTACAATSPAPSAWASAACWPGSCGQAGVSGAAIFALTAWLALIGMWLGGGLTNWLVDRPAQNPPWSAKTAMPPHTPEGA